MRPLLERLPILHSRDFEAGRAFLAERSIGLELAGAAKSAAGFEVRYNGIYLPEMWLGYIAYGDSAVRVKVLPERGDYWLQILLHGGLECSLGSSRMQCDRRRGVVTSPGELHLLRAEPGAARLSVCIQGPAMRRHLASMLADEPAAPLRFAPEIRLDEGRGRNLARVLRCAAAEFESGDWTGSPLVAARFTEFTMTALLLCQPSNYSQVLRKTARPIAPRDVRRAVDYIQDNLAEPITLGDLVREAGVAGRTLLKHFRDCKGVSPIRYLRNLRLDRVRDELRGGGAARVGDAALRWGFAHAGRFSIEYRKRFGESPSATLARGARRW
jgi:AraC-like DNA-binding protein